MIVLTAALLGAAWFFALVADSRFDWRGVFVGAFAVTGLLMFAVKWLGFAVEVALRSTGMWSTGPWP
jgi:hypothetical protein